MMYAKTWTVEILIDELAVARALPDLAHRLLDATVNDIQRVTHRPARLSCAVAMATWTQR